MKMKKVLFPILALVLALSLALPMAAVVGADPGTATFGAAWDDWEKTANRLVDNTSDGVGDAPDWNDTLWGGWVSPAWDGPSNGIDGDAISYWVVNDTWVMWRHTGTDWTQHTDQWFRTTVDIPATWVVTSVELLYKYNEAIIPINDDLYVYVDDKYVAAGGTAGVSWIQGPSYIGTAPPDPTYGSNTFVAAVVPYSFGVAPETGWYLNGGLDLPPELFAPGSHEIHVLGEEFDISGGLGHLVLKVEYVEPSIDLTKSGPTSAHEGDTITYTYLVENTGDVALDNLAVTDNLGITVTEVDVDPADGYNDGDTNTDGVFDPDEIWQFTASYLVPTPQVLDVVNEATAEAWYDTIKVTDSDVVEVDILHPEIEVTKSGPTSGYFESVDDEYIYIVTNPGDVPLEVTLTDSMIADLGTPSGDDSPANGLLDPGETWTYTVTEELICEGQTMSLFTNKATVVGVDEIGGPDGTVEDTACWSVIVFQWQPRTIGYWGNWERH